MLASVKNLFLQAIGTHEGGRLTAHQRRFAVLSLIPILIWVFVFVLADDRSWLPAIISHFRNAEFIPQLQGDRNIALQKFQPRLAAR